MRRIVMFTAAMAISTSIVTVGLAGSASAATRTTCSTFTGNFVFAVASLTGCTDPANTGGSGTPNLDLVPPGTEAGVMIAWLSGGTTTVTMTFVQTTKGCPAGDTDYALSGKVTGSTGVGASVKGKLHGEVCVDANENFMLKPGTKLKL
jgi:hypothetical protein